MSWFCIVLLAICSVASIYAAWCAANCPKQWRSDFIFVAAWGAVSVVVLAIHAYRYFVTGGC